MLALGGGALRRLLHGAGARAGEDHARAPGGGGAVQSHHRPVHEGLQQEVRRSPGGAMWWGRVVGPCGSLLIAVCGCNLQFATARLSASYEYVWFQVGIGYAGARQTR